MAKFIGRNCTVCGKWFVTVSQKKTECSKECKHKANRKAEKKPMEKCKEQLCWMCQNATGGCSWSRNLTPVEGWVAKPSIVDGENTYKIISCPQFIVD